MNKNNGRTGMSMFAYHLLTAPLEQNLNAMKKIKTFEDACKALKINPALLLDVSMLPEGDRKHIIANYKLIKIAEALNEGWKPDWENYNERKYYPWFSMDTPSGFGFSYSHCDHSLSSSGVGSRLCFKSSELAEYAGKQFEAIYNDYLTF